MRCIIITAYVDGGLREMYTPRKDDLVLCADGGYAHAKAAGIRPALVIGDLDSAKGTAIPPDLLLRVPVEKDDTDTMLCVKKAIECGCTECLILGGIGGRLDHTLANIQTLGFAEENGLPCELRGAHDRAFLLTDDEISLPREDCVSLSLLSFTEQCVGVTTSGVKYPLTGAVITETLPMAVSNSFTGPEAHIAVKRGTLLIVLSKLNR